MRLIKRSRIDTLKNEPRKRGNSWDRLIYFGLVGGFLIWMFDVFVGDYVYLRADGLVMRDRIVLATQFPAQVKTLNVAEGSEVAKGQVIVTQRSQIVEESLAKLSAELAAATARRSLFSVRLNVIKAVQTSAKQSSQTAYQNRVKVETLVDSGLVSNQRFADILEREYRTSQALAEMEAEQTGIEHDLPRLEASIEEAQLAREQLRTSYNNGEIEAPANGIVGSLPVRTGSVTRVGDPLMEIFTGDPYVLAYVPEGAIYELEPGDQVNIRVGLKRYLGQISRILPVTSQLPREFQDTLRPPSRAQIIYITFAPGQSPPTLFAKPRISAASWWPRWLGRVVSLSAAGRS